MNDLSREEIMELCFPKREALHKQYKAKMKDLLAVFLADISEFGLLEKEECTVNSVFEFIDNWVENNFRKEAH